MRARHLVATTFGARFMRDTLHNLKLETMAAIDSFGPLLESLRGTPIQNIAVATGGFAKQAGEAVALIGEIARTLQLKGQSDFVDLQDELKQLRQKGLEDLRIISGAVSQGLRVRPLPDPSGLLQLQRGNATLLATNASFLQVARIDGDEIEFTEEELQVIALEASKAAWFGLEDQLSELCSEFGSTALVGEDADYVHELITAFSEISVAVKEFRSLLNNVAGGLSPSTENTCWST